MKKIITIVGARPQFIKASVVSDVIARTKALNEVLIHTGQHFDTNMSDVFFADLAMATPKYYLDIHGGNHGEMTGRMLVAVERVLLEEEPDAVLVYGDTNSTLAGALAAVKLHIPVAHVEAGLRSFNMTMPEEVNRIVTDRISSLLFTPTKAATANLQLEGIAKEKVYQVGDVMLDVAQAFGEKVVAETGLLASLGLSPSSYILVTVHRAENTDSPDRLVAIVHAVVALAEKLSVVWPMHPRTRSVLTKMGIFDSLRDKVHVTDPASYLDMVQLEKFSALILTDSGGVQKEAYFYRVPCVTLRDETEWVELIDAGWNRLAPPTDCDSITEVVMTALGSEGRSVDLYGDGTASELIVERLKDI